MNYSPIYRGLYIASKSLLEDTKRVWIFSDSLSSLKRLKRRNNIGKGQFLVSKIFTISNSLRAKSISTNIEWIPGHYNIEGNENADKLAKTAISRPLYKDAYISTSYTSRIIRESLITNWLKDWQTTSTSKGKTYSSLVGNIPKIRLKIPPDKVKRST